MKTFHLEKTLWSRTCQQLILFFLLFISVLFVPALQAASIALQLSDQDGNPVNDAVIYITGIDGQLQLPPRTPGVAEVDQIGEAFIPHVRAVTVGTSIVFPNSDHIRHHVYSFSEANTFELPLYIGIPAEPIVFDKAGLVTLGCNIHDHMLGYVLVLDTSLFAEVKDGIAHLDNIPAGKLGIEIWHPRLQNDEVLSLSLQIAADSELKIEESVVLRPERMVRRAPRRSSSRY